MARRTVYLPDGLDEAARKAGLNVSQLAQRAIRDELERHACLQVFSDFLHGQEAGTAPPSADELAAAQAWATEMLSFAHDATIGGTPR